MPHDADRRTSGWRRGRHLVSAHRLYGPPPFAFLAVRTLVNSLGNAAGYFTRSRRGFLNSMVLTAALCQESLHVFQRDDNIWWQPGRFLHVEARL